MNKLKLFFILLITLLSLGYNLNTNIKTLSLKHSIVTAEEDEDEDEDEEEEEDEDEDEEDKDDDNDDYYYNNNTNQTPDITDFTPTNESVNETKPIEYKEVVTTTYIQVTEDAYKNDSDGDKLVDAIDPDPNIPQNEFFTDSDNDGVPNAEDKFKGRNDFLYFGNEDLDNNGVVDLYELY